MLTAGIAPLRPSPPPQRPACSGAGVGVLLAAGREEGRELGGLDPLSAPTLGRGGHGSSVTTAGLPVHDRR